MAAIVRSEYTIKKLTCQTRALWAEFGVCAAEGAITGMSGVRVIFPDCRCVQEGVLFWTTFAVIPRYTWALIVAGAKLSISKLVP